MRILFDQGVPAPLRLALAEHDVLAAFELGWSTLSNGELLPIRGLDDRVPFPLQHSAQQFPQRGVVLLELADCLIAATAVTEGAPLATGNVRDYPMPEVRLLPARR